ncbi:hypothetical protein [Bradyrhizobium sp. Cp5.3]|uniref:hypothetical protein n=1 Tax=Bradyrhizobium sp. Cp5.3 TaxID=443598 RepID=UPI000A039667|nr:hypothetical protein [Bradyrhizobium sp. Cp5.3]
MKRSMALAAAALLVIGTRASNAAVWITDDRGGQIGKYIYRYEKLRASGQRVIIGGFCASACTIVLGTIPSSRICVTPNAELAFHAAWDFGRRGRAVTNFGATRMVYSMYPAPIRRWIAHRGGLTPRTLFLRGRRLQAMYRSCSS